jgi:class 3 adenylate cyclase
LDGLKLRESEHIANLNDDSVEQMLDLAERLRTANGGLLDDTTIQAVAEATGFPVDFVRITANLRTRQVKKGLLAVIRTQLLTIELQTRRFVLSGVAAATCALCQAAAARAQSSQLEWAASSIGIIQLLGLTLALYNACVARDSKTGAIVGGIFGAGYFTAYELCGLAFHLTNSRSYESILILPITVAGAVAGIALQKITYKYRNRLGLRDPIRERQELLRQLTDLQERLKSGEQEVTFLSVDIVGSTRMKEVADPLAVEYTFTEYHEFVARIARKHGGRVHSTAGDGVTCAFEHPQPAFQAAKNISAGLLELNTFRNKVGLPIVVRQAVHTGIIMAPEDGDVTKVNFAHVIDIAAHLQKVAPAGSIVISDVSAAKIPGGPAAIGDQKVNASGVEGTIWNSRPVVQSTAPEGPPPIPKLV